MLSVAPIKLTFAQGICAVTLAPISAAVDPIEWSVRIKTDEGPCSGRDYDPIVGLIEIDNGFGVIHWESFPDDLPAVGCLRRVRPTPRSPRR
jgi:hypothetical protein